jgi:putative CRISPR-associated protein (TIGR02619 family)
MDEKRFVLSTVGTTILNNMLNESERAEGWSGRLNQVANEHDIKAGPLDKAQELNRRATAQLQSATPDQVRRWSPELNGLYAIYDGHMVPGVDVHWLVATDTALGRLAAEVICDHLKSMGFNATTVLPEGLSAGNTKSFSRGIKWLIKWCEECIPGYADSGYKVIFNLTGGFKILQGYLNTIGMLYANEVSYIYEGASQLVTIPRLPLRVDTEQLGQFRVKLAMMAEGHVFTQADLAGLSEALLEEDGGSETLSEWGQLIWQRVRAELLSDKEPIHFPRLQFERSFIKDYKAINSDNERIQLNEVLAKVASSLEYHHGDTASMRQDGGLQYDNYSGHEPSVGHFRVTQDLRVSCIADGGTLCLRHYGNEPYVNANP